MSLVAADRLTGEGNALFQQGDFAGAAERYERAAVLFPEHHLAWKGLGHALLCLARPTEAARAFDRAIGLKSDSATALWGGALAHADLGHKPIAQNYLKRTLALQPSWTELARSVPALAQFLQISTYAGEILRVALGPPSLRTFRHAADPTRAIDVARYPDVPEPGHVTYGSLGLSNVEWPDGRPRIEVLLACVHDSAGMPQLVANTAFHIIDQQFYPTPGSVVRDLVGVLRLGDLSLRFPHMFFTVPRRWGLRLPLDEGPPAITITSAVPISEREYRYWKDGGEDLPRRLAAVDTADFARAEVV
ncbi:MAG: tetratricopeptide repeat protein [Myxococcales bacterium]|nr:tetratricopeptide repeat protein [Myxococcales bacterium]